MPNLALVYDSTQVLFALLMLALFGPSTQSQCIVLYYFTAGVILNITGSCFLVTRFPYSIIIFHFRYALFILLLLLLFLNFLRQH